MAHNHSHTKYSRINASNNWVDLFRSFIHIRFSTKVDKTQLYNTAEIKCDGDRAVNIQILELGQ